MISNGKHHAGSAGGGEGIPPPKDQDLMLDAWREVLAQVLHTRDNEWKQQLRAIKAESLAAVAEMRANVAETRSAMEDMIAKRLAQIREPADGARGELGPRGEPGPPGKIETVRAYVHGAVHYERDVVVHEGSTYMAKHDTARTPPHDDWQLIAARGRDAAMPKIMGTYREGESYSFLNIVALGGSSFVARTDDPGPCPGEGWQLIASAGRPGKQGQKGERGEQGQRGERGAVAPTILGWKIDRERYCATPIMSDNSEVEPLQLRALFEQFHDEAS
ncbi:hypothetical protein ABIF68_003668 [Bradyrhizobium japonicum]|jgi:hypothetical protein|uniref:collagen-like triple helix repeat-containing protein n=2 Tax=Nitrobacteraceae TaxID=41294 RepID=UPI0004BBBA74|nr:collagen-like protein [Bradyrhizobium japonicum]